jgi:hypothetical protein
MESDLACILLPQLLHSLCNHSIRGTRTWRWTAFSILRTRWSPRHIRCLCDSRVLELPDEATKRAMEAGRDVRLAHSHQTTFPTAARNRSPMVRISFHIGIRGFGEVGGRKHVHIKTYSSPTDTYGIASLSQPRFSSSFVQSLVTLR